MTCRTTATEGWGAVAPDSLLDLSTIEYVIIAVAQNKLTGPETPVLVHEVLLPVGWFLSLDQSCVSLSVHT